MKRPIIQFTKEGLQKVKDDLARLAERRKGALVSLQTAREMGDLSENGAYKAARFELSDIDREMRRLSYQEKFGIVIKPVARDVIGFGARVTVKKDDRELTFTLVGAYEANPSENKLSIRSPLGNAVLGKRAGDSIKVALPAGIVTYSIVNFTPPIS